MKRRELIFGAPVFLLMSHRCGLRGCVANSEGTAKRSQILRIAKQRRDQR
jgi:hypothetical protein